MSIYVWGWIVFGLGAAIVGEMAFELIRDRDRPRGRHSRDERVEPKDRPAGWQRLRLMAANTLIFAVILMTDSAKASNPLRFPAKGLVLAATITLVIWEARSWRQFDDPADRRHAISSARWFVVPLGVQVLWMLHIWDNGVARIVASTTTLLILAGPDVEPWIRRRLQRRAGGTTPT
ncbi:MAG TPA: hypothetical protein VFI65_13170 [Streptosporangiaceae bacterium]|nr:hypothetical protein [Streptosporangiaceae bacterium]